MRTLWGPSIVYNVQRALSAGIALNLFALVIWIADLLGGGQGFREFLSQFSSPIEATVGALALVVGFAIAPLVYVPVGLACAWVRRQVGDVSLLDFSIGSIAKLMIASASGMIALACLIILMLGDPGIVLFHRFFPHLVPVERPKVWNPYFLIRVEGIPSRKPKRVHGGTRGGAEFRISPRLPT